MNPYVYAANSPMMFVDPDGESATAIIVFIASKMLINYGTQVYMNHQVRNLSGADAWFNQIDFADVVLAGAEAGLMIAFPGAAPYLQFGMPFATNAINIWKW